MSRLNVGMGFAHPEGVKYSHHPGAKIANSQAAKMRTAKTMVKTNRRRGRG